MAAMDNDSDSWSSESVNDLLCRTLDEYEQSVTSEVSDASGRSDFICHNSSRPDLNFSNILESRVDNICQLEDKQTSSAPTNAPVSTYKTYTSVMKSLAMQCYLFLYQKV